MWWSGLRDPFPPSDVPDALWLSRYLFHRRMRLNADVQTFWISEGRILLWSREFEWGEKIIIKKQNIKKLLTKWSGRQSRPPQRLSSGKIIGPWTFSKDIVSHNDKVGTIRESFKTPSFLKLDSCSKKKRKIGRFKVSAKAWNVYQ